MTPSEIRDELEGIQALARGLEDQVGDQKAADVRYHEVLHEITEGWEAFQRAIEKVDEIGGGMS